VEKKMRKKRKQSVLLLDYQHFIDIAICSTYVKSDIHFFHL